MLPDQIDTLVSLSAPTLSPDGTIAVVAASHPSFEADTYVGQLWRFRTSGEGSPRRITRGKSDSAPQFSPDGTLLAFLRSVEGKPQLAVVEADGGEPQVLTNAPLGVGGFVWAPDSGRIAFTASIPEAGRYGTLTGVSAGQEAPRRVTGNQWRANGRGFIADQPVGIHVLEVPRGEAPWIEPVGRAAAPEGSSSPIPVAAGKLGGAKGLPEALLISPADRDSGQPTFSPDGAWVYFVSALHETADDDLRTSIYRVPSAGGSEPEIVAPAGGTLDLHSPAFAGTSLLCLGQDMGESGLDFIAKITGVYEIEAGGSARLLTDANMDEFGGGDGFVVATDSNAILAPLRARGGDSLIRFGANGEREEILVRGERILTGGAERNGTLAVTFSDPSTPGELAVVREGELVTLSNCADGIPAPVQQREFVATGPDGYPVHGWVYLPAGEGPHPVLLNIHGGPFADYSWGYFDEPQVYAEAGYAVVQCNPRGAQGYGRAHGVAIKERMGTVDMQDVLAFLDGAIVEFDQLDGDRVGILGGSYGGYLTAWTIAHDHRFAAAIVERGFLDPLSFIGVSDIGWFFAEEYVGRDPEHALTQSPQAVAGRVRTPTLVMHSEEDWRCPPDQAQRYFATLRRAGVEAEMLLFPGENHELSRSGTPWHRRQRFEAMLEWFGRYLPVGR